jgi:hypothetical protein
MFKKPQIVSLLFVFLFAGFVLITTNCDFDAGALMEKLEAQSLWEESGHADRTAEAFTHWDEDVPPVVSDRCAKCHSTSGYLDFLGADGSAAGTVDVAPAIGETVECEVCHTDPDNGILRDHASVTFPSGTTIDNLGPEGLCMECHQGRESTPDVDQEITDSGAPDDDTIDSDMGFPNIHYYAAAATQFGTFVQGGYEYSGNDYDARFSHVKGYNDCFTCHNPHSLEIRIERCGTCHTGSSNPKDFRHYGSFVDYDGDGDMTEGIYYEIPDFQDKLYEAIQAYARQIGNPIVYDSHSHPYWFYDTNDNGEVDPGEDVDYESFTGRLLKACYNYQVSLKDPGGYAHGGKYIIQLLYDSIEDLNEYLTTDVDIDDFERDDEGHFDGSKEAWRHWDEDVPAEVEADCAKCHSAEGLAYYLENDAHIAQEITNGMLCTTCHTSPPNLRTASSVTFPSGISKSMSDSSNLCITCHQGQHAKATVDAGITAGTPGQYNFTDFNVHYYAAGAVLYGTEVQGGYEFATKVYAGRNPFPNHNGRFDTCVECHMGTNTARETREPSDHNVHKPNPEDCVFCHGYDVSQPNPGNDPSKFKFSGIRPYSIPDFDGDGNITESIENEIKGLEAALYAQIQWYAFFTLVNPIIYADNYPYFFKDTNGNGIVDPGENIFPNQYGPNMDATLLRAAYNFQLSKKEPHGFIHNPFYIAQLLVDSIESLGGNVAIYTWR